MQLNRDRADIEEAHMIPSFRKPRRRRLAFTVVELLVVVAIIGVLVSILLPAVGAVRDSARRTQNGNNLRNIGQAVLAYEENKGTYPPLLKRSKNFPNELTKSVSWAFEILPFIEQDAIHSRFDPDRTCVVIDPPRNGCDESFLSQLVSFAPRRLIYISCNPSTQARDIKELSIYNYKLKKILPLDMFPHTPHLESIAVIEK